ncbi:MAG TPA: hypothetical protein VLA14_04270 [Polyangia bacterium]|nr:hypothetical protein [Polyangia bacterium]
MNNTPPRVQIRPDRRLGRTRGASVTLSLILGATACSSSSSTPADKAGQSGHSGGDAGTQVDGASDAGDAGVPFTAALPASYVAKVKNILVGLPPTDAEVTSIAADPTKMKALVQSWMALPGYQTKMKRFFELAFQQTQVSAVDFADQTFPKEIGINTTTTPLLVQNAQQSFALTMIELLSEGRPLTDATTTNKLMMTTALKELYAFLDVWQVADDGTVTDLWKKANAKQTITVEASVGPIPIAQTLDPTSPNYMHWYDPDVPTNDMNVAGCAADPIVYAPSAATIHYLLYGALDGHKNPTTGGLNCPPSGGSATAPQLDATKDFSDWTLVTIRPPAGPEATTTFYDIPSLRAAKELVLSIPRAGFFSTPAFFANWQTNTSNQMRVTMNQTLIVALGAQVDGSDRTVPTSTPGLDTTHASQAACAVCHVTLDPLRSIFASTYSWNYHAQDETAFAAQKGMFIFQGVQQPVTSTGDMGGVLAQHPLFGSAWAQKLCTYANSSPCLPTDPEFLRVVTAFKTASYSWDALVAELMSSPLVTNASPTATAAANGEVVAVSRRDHLCAALNARLGFDDVCGLNAVTRKQEQAAITQIASGLPSDGYGRGATMPVLPNQPTLFYRAGTENICTTVAAMVIDVATAKQVAGVTQWSSTKPTPAIADFVSIVMGLVPSDPRAAPATALLTSHFTAAMTQGATASDALKSTFITACLAPSAVSIGL